MNEIRKALSYNSNNNSNNNSNSSNNNKLNGNNENGNAAERGLSSSLVSEYNDYRKNVRHIYMIDVKDNIHRNAGIDDSKR